MRYITWPWLCSGPGFCSELAIIKKRLKSKTVHARHVEGDINSLLLLSTFYTFLNLEKVKDIHIYSKMSWPHGALGAVTIATVFFKSNFAITCLRGILNNIHLSNLQILLLFLYCR